MISTGLRLAFVKQDVYQDLYACPPRCHSPYLYSLMRSGPLGLFKAFRTDTYVIKYSTSADIWKEKIADCPHHRSHEEWLAIPTKKIKYEGEWIEQQFFALDVMDIPFDEYDIVIAVDACVPSEVVKRGTKTLWCYYISEACMRSYSNSYVQPLEGYHVFLNQMFRPSDSPLYRDLPEHVCEFPYTLQYPGIHKELFGFGQVEAKLEATHKISVSIPRYCINEIPEADLGLLDDVASVITPSGDVRDFLGRLNTTNAYCRLGCSTKFGNETIEAVCAGNILVSTKFGWKNRVFSPSPLDISGKHYSSAQMSELKERLITIINDSQLAEDEKARQEGIARELGFNRPIADLLEKYEKFNCRRTASMPSASVKLQTDALNLVPNPMLLQSLKGAQENRKPTCFVLAFDAFDKEMARSTAIFYSQAGYLVDVGKEPKQADLIVWMRGRPPKDFRFIDFAQHVHFYPYVGTPYAEDVATLLGTNATIVYPSETLIYKIRSQFPDFKYIHGMPPVWLGEWSSLYSVPSLKRRFEAPVHIGHFKEYNLISEDLILGHFISACDRTNAHVWGRGWDAYLGPAIAKGISTGPISAAYSRYRIALGIMYSYQRMRTVSMRAWEAPLSGCVLLVESLPKSNDLLPPGVIEIDYSKVSLDDMSEIASRYEPVTLASEALAYWQRRNSELFANLDLELAPGIGVDPYLSVPAQEHFGTLPMM